MRHASSRLPLLSAFLIASASMVASAGPLDLKETELDTIGTQSAIEQAIKASLPTTADPSSLPFGVNKGYAFSDTFKARVKAGFDTPMGDDMRLKDAAIEAQLSLGRIGPSISWGWFTGVDMRVQSGDAGAVTSGPQFKVGGDKLALTLSPKLEHTFGSNHDAGAAFAYAAGLKSEITKGVALGIEAFGSLSEINAVASDASGHRTSPSLYVGIGLTPPMKSDANGSKFSLEVGALAGMGETAPDLTGKVKAAVTW